MIVEGVGAGDVLAALAVLESVHEEPTDEGTFGVCDPLVKVSDHVVDAILVGAPLERSRGRDGVIEFEEARIALIESLERDQRSASRRTKVARSAPPTEYGSGRGRRVRLRALNSWRRFREDWRIFAQNRLAILGLVLIALFGILALNTG